MGCHVKPVIEQIKLNGLVLLTCCCLASLLFIASDGLYSPPHLFHIVVLKPHLKFSFIVQSCLLQAPPQVMYQLKYLPITSLESLLFLVKGFLNVTGNPRFIVEKAANGSYWYIDAVQTSMWSISLSM